MKRIKEASLYKWVRSIYYSLLRHAWKAQSNKIDRKYDVDFSIWATNDDLGISPKHGNPYQPSTHALVKVLKKMGINSNDSIIDIGAGKGQAIYYMSKFPFKHIDGLELSPQLCKIANDNISKIGINRCTIINGDAATFSIYNTYNYFYMFNPFPEDIFAKTLANILDSVGKCPRKIYLIYMNPVCHDLIIQNDFKLLFQRKGITKWLQYNCYIYEPSSESLSPHIN